MRRIHGGLQLIEIIVRRSWEAPDVLPKFAD